MVTILYTLLKASLDPIIFVLALAAAGFVISSRSRGKRSGRLFLGVLFLVLYVTSISPIPNAICYILEKDYLIKDRDNIGKFDIVIVLGGGVSDNKYLEKTLPSLQTTSRLLYAVQVFRKSGAKYLVCAGKGVGRVSEAEVMGDIAIQLGMLPTSIKIDSESRNTWEHAKNLNIMFQDKDIKIGLVTSAYHMKRSEREFRKYFSNITPLPSDYLYSSPKLLIITFLPRSGNLYKSYIALHEIIGIGWYKITG